MIPGSPLPVHLNACQRALAVPVARLHPVLWATPVNRGDAPREARPEALWLFVERDLAGRAG